MLGEKSYDKIYVDACRAKIKDTLDAFKKIDAPGAFENLFLTHMVLALDHYFLHRLRGAEGKDGNPLNEVRMLCNAFERQNGVMTADSTIKYDAGRAVLNAKIGQRVNLKADEVAHLADAFFSEIEARYP